MKTIIDSGTTLIYGPPDIVAKLYASIPGSAVFQQNSEFYTFPCANVPLNIAFSWGGKQWTISPEKSVPLPSHATSWVILTVRP